MLVSLQLLAYLPVDELEEGVLIQIIVKVVRRIGLFVLPGPRHLQLLMEVVSRVHPLLYRWLNVCVSLLLVLLLLLLLLLLFLQNGQVVEGIPIKKTRKRVSLVKIVGMQVIVE